MSILFFIVLIILKDVKLCKYRTADCYTKYIYWFFFSGGGGVEEVNSDSST